MNQPQDLLLFFKDTPFEDGDIERVAAGFSEVVFKKGELIVAKGDTPNHFYLLTEGLIRAYSINELGEEVTTDFFEAPDVVIGWLSFMTQNPSKESFVAMGKTVCWQMDYADFQQLFHEVPGFREWGRVLLANKYYNLKTHHLSFITNSAKSRYLNLVENHPTILQKATLRQIASYLGINAVSLSRIRKQLTQEP